MRLFFFTLYKVLLQLVYWYYCGLDVFCDELQILRTLNSARYNRIISHLLHVCSC